MFTKTTFLWLFLLPGIQPLAAQKPLPTTWDEGLPMGNAILGCLVWQHNGHLRLSLDRSDLWDLRPMAGLDRPEFSYKWVTEQVAKNDYGIVQKYFDEPYEREAGPTKLPGAALEFEMPPGGMADLDISNGLTKIQYPGNLLFQTFVHAGRREGWFRFTGDPKDLGKYLPSLLPPVYSGTNARQDMAQLGYNQANVFLENGIQVYHQPCWGGFSYEVAVAVKQQKNGVLEGVWCVSSHFTQKPWLPRAAKVAQKALHRGFDKSFRESAAWWNAYWSKSKVRLPDPVLQHQYNQDMYKFGCVARSNAPMISLQAVWTADNGHLPPWKGDFHHDLNTQLSYWPAYTANHLNEAMGYLRHIESNEEAHRKYTRQYFGDDGINVPGVETLLGEPMGGWIQYSLSPTTSAWIAQHFYLQWRYSQDRIFLKNHAFPFIKAVADHLEAVTIMDRSSGKRVLPISSSPEINDNGIGAWFPNTLTNYDRALIRFVFEKTAELDFELGHKADAGHWKELAAQLPEWTTEPNGALKFAPALAYNQSHRHFSHMLGIYPLGLLNWHGGPADRRIIQASLMKLDSVGTQGWTGYSFAWLANLRALAHDGDGARKALQIFAEAFVSTNTFHLNGDQSGKGYSASSGRPFTLEGNFASASGIQEMLLQSHNGEVEVFPAIPGDWNDVSFHNLRTDGAFLVTAERKNGRLTRLEIYSEKGNPLKLRLPDSDLHLESTPAGFHEMPPTGSVRNFTFKRGQRLIFVAR
jgi:alpha-L-fucosidase 2